MAWCLVKHRDNFTFTICCQNLLRLQRKSYGSELSVTSYTRFEAHVNSGYVYTYTALHYKCLEEAYPILMVT
jgi:hypothetical protein